MLPVLALLIMTNISGPAEDLQLVQRLQARDKSAMADLLHQHGAKLYGVALQITRTEPAAQEVMQDALIAIWTKIGQFEGRSAFATWCYRVTTNAALMYLRKNKRFDQHVRLESYGGDRGLPVLQIADPKPGPVAKLTQAELGEQVRAAINALPDPYRTTVLLADIEEMSLDEIAEATDASIPAVKSRLHRARLALRKALTPYLKDQA